MTTLEEFVGEVERALNVHKVAMVDHHGRNDCKNCALDSFIEVLLFDIKKELAEESSDDHR